ncbi:MAG TPA: YitT family protein [Prolixibacteraceae bacterium]|nr:YitT family protein [Prolixibacteraceae bacterium]HPR84938.1 YitT family protein [Prolixibacteraceae bacterium]
MVKAKQVEIKSVIKDYTIMLAGLILYVLSWTLFLIPAQITGGGISGLAAVIYYSTKIPMGLTYFAINVVLISFALKILGPNFGVKTVFNMVALTLLFAIPQEYFPGALIEDNFLSAVLGGMMGGIGIGLVFSRGGSTGGTDIIAMIINKYKNISPGRIILYCDVIIISSSYFLVHSIEKMVYGFVTMAVVSYTLDAFLSGSNASAQIFIFSPKYDEIADFINTESVRGVTVIDGTGWYTQQDVKILMTIVRKKEASIIFRKVKEIDPEAFISMGSVMGVYGKGFDKLKG